MEKRGFLTSEAFSYAWDTFKKNWGIFLVLAIITGVLSSLQYKVEDNEPVETGKVIIGILFGVLSMIVNIGVLKVTLNIYDEKEVEILDVFRYAGYFWRYLGATIIYSVIVGVGFILLLIPGIIWALKYSMVFNLIVDKDMKVFEAFNESSKMTEGFKLKLLLFGFACLGVIILGALALVVGLIVAMPVIWLAGVYVYRHILIGDMKNA